MKRMWYERHDNGNKKDNSYKVAYWIKSFPFAKYKHVANPYVLKQSHPNTFAEMWKYQTVSSETMIKYKVQSHWCFVS